MGSIGAGRPLPGVTGSGLLARDGALPPPMPIIRGGIGAGRCAVMLPPIPGG